MTRSFPKIKKPGVRLPGNQDPLKTHKYFAVCSHTLCPVLTQKQATFMLPF